MCMFVCFDPAFSLGLLKWFPSLLFVSAFLFVFLLLRYG